MKYRIRYYLRKIFKFLGFCYYCKSTINFTRDGVGICPNCRKRY